MARCRLGGQGPRTSIACPLASAVPTRCRRQRGHRMRRCRYRSASVPRLAIDYQVETRIVVVGAGLSIRLGIDLQARRPKSRRRSAHRFSTQWSMFRPVRGPGRASHRWRTKPFRRFADKRARQWRYRGPPNMQLFRPAPPWLERLPCISNVTDAQGDMPTGRQCRIALAVLGCGRRRRWTVLTNSGGEDFSASRRRDRRAALFKARSGFHRAAAMATVAIAVDAQARTAGWKRAPAQPDSGPAAVPASRANPADGRFAAMAAVEQKCRSARRYPVLTPECLAGRVVMCVEGARPGPVPPVRGQPDRHVGHVRRSAIQWGGDRTPRALSPAGPNAGPRTAQGGPTSSLRKLGPRPGRMGQGRSPTSSMPAGRAPGLPQHNRSTQRSSASIRKAGHAPRARSVDQAPCRTVDSQPKTAAIAQAWILATRMSNGTSPSIVSDRDGCWPEWTATWSGWMASQLFARAGLQQPEAEDRRSLQDHQRPRARSWPGRGAFRRPAPG